MDGTSRPWGVNSICLHLPVSLVLLDGLSREQHRAVSQNYESFVAGGSEPLREADVVCLADRLDQPLEVSPEPFTVNGQYAPRKRRLGGEIEITGLDFVGSFTRNGQFPVQATLSVEKEMDFPRFGVLENFLRILISHHALDRGGVLLHSVGVLHQGRAYLFTGRSNAGKTTLARKAAAAGARVLSDDINLVVMENGGFQAHKVPFTGEFGRRAENISGCGSFPLGGLILLEKAPALTPAPVSPAEGVAGLLAGCPYVNDDPEEFPAVMDVLTRLVSRTPIVRLGVALDDPFEAVMATLSRFSENV